MEASDILKAVSVLEQTSGIKASDDASLKFQTDKQEKQDDKTVTESVPAGKPEIKEVEDQNAKANKNWTVEDKTKVASSLIALAKQLLAD